MRNSFHLTENGPKPCTASVRDCPVGGTHFTDKEAAERAFEFKADKKFSPLGALKKKKADPFTRHISDAEKRIRSLEKDMLVRDARQENGTIYHEFLAEGVTAEELEERFNEETNLRQGGLSYVRTEEGAVRAIGLSYGGDYKAEEEYGAAAIGKALRNGDFGPDDVLLYTEGDTTFLAVRGERGYGWTNDPKTNELVAREAEKAKKRYDEYVPYEQSDLRWKLRRLPMAELRAELKGKVVPLPKSKDEAISEVIKLRSEKTYRTPAMGEFQTGKALVIATKDPVEAKMMQKLKESHDGGNLRLGNSANPFSRGVSFYDDRDLTREHKSDLIRTEEAMKSSTAYIADTKTKLSANGSLFAVSPRVDGDLKDVRDSTYWLNLSPRNHKQIFGSFNKEQLERIASGDYSDVPEKD